MMRRWFYTLLFFLPAFVFAQPYGNEWIDYNQRYVKFKVYKTGLHRINYNALNSGLSSVGISINTPGFDPRNIQVFGRGREIPIYIETGANTAIDPGDYIEFYAKHNDGWLDSLLYETPSALNNPHYSLINDTATYYLTVNNSTNNKRYSSFSQTNYSSYQPAPYILRKSLQQYTSNYETGATDFSGKTESAYTAGEGWFDNVVTYLGNRTKTIPTPNRYSGSGAPNALFEIVYTGASNASNVAGNDHSIRIELNNTIIADTVFEGYKLIRQTRSVPVSQIGNGTTDVEYSSLPLNPSPNSDRTAISWISITYPQTTDFNGKQTYDFYTAPNAQFTRIDVNNFTGQSISYLYNLTDHQRITITQSGNGFQAIIPPGGSKHCHIAATSQVTGVNSLEAVEGNGLFTDYSQNPPDSAFLIITHQKLINEANQYAARKRQVGFSTKVIDINNLYGQFSYGIRKHPLSIRNFANFTLNEWPVAPQYLFLIGKSISDYLCRNNNTNYQNNLVPTFGFPSTDNLFTAGLQGTKYETAISTGRLMAFTPGEVLTYTQKVDQFQGQGNQPYNIAEKEWMKNVLHFGGGANASEQNQLRNYLLAYENTITEPHYGGSVTSFYKNTTSVIQQTVSDSVEQLINRGVSLLTFFGHAAGTALDISIDNVETYDNFGKYFLFLANSCNVGDIHTPVQTVPGVNKSFVLTPGKGAIAFLASVTLGYPARLHAYTRNFYINLSSEHYGASIGKLMQETVKDIQASPLNKATCLEMSLHGDPSLVLNTHKKPEYVLSPDRYFLSPREVTADEDSFSVNVVVTNIGKAVDKSISFQVRRFLPNGDDTLIATSIDAPDFKDTVETTFAVDAGRAIGLNRFEVQLDYPLVEVDEFDNFSNNRLTFDTWISSDELIPIYPANLSIVPDDISTFYSSTADPMSPNREYFFEVDTTGKFNSPAKKTLSQTASGGVVEWQPNLTLWNDSTVYYWRVSPKPDPGYKWRTSSFTYVPGQSGWGETHFEQWESNDYQFINYNTSNRSLDFLPNEKDLDVQVIGHPQNQQEYNFHEYRLNGVLQEYGVCPPVAPSMYIAVIDSLTLEPWGTHYTDPNAFPPINENPDHSFGNSNDLNNCRSRVENFFSFVLTDPSQVSSMINMVENEVPDGHYLLAYTVVRGEFSDTTIWTDQYLDLFENLGATSIRSVNDSVPYIFFAQKGKPATAIEKIGSGPRDIVRLNTSITNNHPRGSMTTPLIGPAKSWGQLNWKMFSGEGNRNDSLKIEVFGVNKNRQETKLKTYRSRTGNEPGFNTIVDASAYPFMRLRLTLADDSLQTPSQPGFVHTLYEPYPELAIDFNKTFVFQSDTLQQGEGFKVITTLRNLSEQAVGTTYKQIEIADETTGDQLTEKGSLPGFTAFGTRLDTFSMNTRSIRGPQAYYFELNPRQPEAEWIPELYHFNNLLSRRFFVKTDQTNPLMDITFDGIHILDGDIVSPTPEIVVRLEDENPFLPVDDTSYFDVYVIDPSRNQKRIPFNKGGKENMRFKKASLPENEAQIIFNPDFREDGVYELMVQASDASYNESGDNRYKISFEVINKSTITQVMNYPNPFSTSTRFVFTLTGRKVPDVFTIQILTVSGRVIREITKNELGNIHIGRNITDYAWDGRDEFGDPVGNGVYLYRVVTKIDGEKVERRSSGADRFFTKEFGKMVIMR